MVAQFLQMYPSSWLFSCRLVNRFLAWFWALLGWEPLVDLIQPGRIVLVDSGFNFLHLSLKVFKSWKRIRHIFISTIYAYVRMFFCKNPGKIIGRENWVTTKLSHSDSPIGAKSKHLSASSVRIVIAKLTSSLLSPCFELLRKQKPTSALPDGCSGNSATFYDVWKFAYISQRGSIKRPRAEMKINHFGIACNLSG